MKFDTLTIRITFTYLLTKNNASELCELILHFVPRWKKNCVLLVRPNFDDFRYNLLNYERDTDESTENIDSVNTPLNKLRFHRVLMPFGHRWHRCWCRWLQRSGLARCQRLQDLSSASSSSSSSNRRRESSLSSVGVCWEIQELYWVGFAYINF